MHLLHLAVSAATIKNGMSGMPYSGIGGNDCQLVSKREGANSARFGFFLPLAVEDPRSCR